MTRVRWISRAGALVDTIGRFHPVYQLTVNLGSHRRFNDAVVHIAQNPRLGAKFNPIAGFDVALDDAVENDAGRNHRTFDAALLAHRQKGGRVGISHDIAIDMPVDMQATGKFDVAVDPGFGPDQGGDARAVTRFPFEHLHPF